MSDESIFLDALEKQTLAERSAYLDEVCAGDPAQRNRIEGLLAAHLQASSFLRCPTHTCNPEDDISTETPSQDSLDSYSFLGPPTRADSLGRLSHYEMLELLGRGGFGIVFRAFDESLQRVVAIKVMAPELATGSPARKRFLREARAYAAVQQENVVQVHAIEPEPLPYLVMEYVPGESLQKLLNRKGPLDAPVVFRIGIQLARGLAAAHETGLIHRDIKPDNILLDREPNWQVKITDFGLARTEDDASLTQSGVIAGTPMYMAPEQARGEPLDHRADLFSFGSVLYAMTTGRPPFRARTAIGVMKRVLDDSPRPITDVIPETPRCLCEVIDKLLRKDPASRYQSAAEVEEVLSRHLVEYERTGTFADPHPASSALPTSLWQWVTAVSIVLVAVLAIGIWSTRARGPGKGQPGEAGKGPTPHSRGQLSPAQHEPVRPRFSYLAIAKRFPSGRKLPDTDLFPGRVFRYTFDDDTPAQSPLRTEPEDLAQRWLVREGTARLEGIQPGGRLAHLRQLMPDVKPGWNLAFALRFRPHNADWSVVFRRPADQRRDFLLLEGDSDGNWVLKRQRGDLIQAILARKNKKETGLATDRWLNLVVLCLERRVTLWVNGEVLADIPNDRMGSQDSGAWPTDGIWLGMTGTLPAIPIVEMDYLTIWDLPTDLKPTPHPNATFTDADANRIASLPPKRQVDVVTLALRKRNLAFEGAVSPILSDGRVVGLSVSHSGHTLQDISPMRSLRDLRTLRIYGAGLKDLSPLKGLPLRELDLNSQCTIRDIRPLKGMPLEHLNLWTFQGDLSPLKGMPLKHLNCGGGYRKLDLSPLAGLPLEWLCINYTDVKDLSALKGAPLKELLIEHTKVSDLSALKGMPLKRLYCAGSPVTDLRVLKELPLEALGLNFNPERDTEILKSIPTLKRINNKPAAEFLGKQSQPN